MTLILSSLVSEFKSPKNPKPQKLIFRRGKGGGVGGGVGGWVGKGGGGGGGGGLEASVK